MEQKYGAYGYSAPQGWYQAIDSVINLYKQMLFSGGTAGPSPLATAPQGINVASGAFQINVYSDTENLVELAEKVEEAIASNIRTGRSEIFQALNEVTQ